MTYQTYTPLHSLGSDYRIGRCNNTNAGYACSHRPVFAWHSSTGLRLEDVTCPFCGRLLDRTSREANGYRMLTDTEIAGMREAAIARYETRLGEYHDVAKAWDEEMELYEADSADAYRCQLNYDRYIEAAANATKNIRRLRKAAA